MSAASLAVRRPVFIGMVTLAGLLFGLISLTELPVNLLPDLSYPTLTVRTKLEGAAPSEVENLLTEPLEEVLGVVKNVRDIHSVTRAGQADVILRFSWGTDMDMAGLDVRSKLDTLALVAEASRPVVLRFDPANDPILRLVLSTGEQADASGLKRLRRFAEQHLRKDLETLPGVAAVKVSGGLEDEVQIQLDAGRMAQLNLDSSVLVQRLKAENINLSGGNLQDGNQRYLVRTVNQFTTLDDFRNTVLSVRDGQPIYLREVARVQAGSKERRAIIRVNGREGVEIALYKEGDANTVAVARAVRKRLASERQSLPDGMQLAGVDDQSQFIESAIRQVVVAALLGGLLAVFVLYVFLGEVWATWVIATAIPISVITAFFLMRQFSVSLNIMSLGGIALAVGMLVDNAVVVLENIVRHRREAHTPLREAAIIGSREVAAAVTASTLTTVSVFMPLVFVKGVAGQLFRDQALTVTFSLLISLLVALLLLPMLVSVFGGNAPAAGDEKALQRPPPVFTRADHIGYGLMLFPLIPVLRGFRGIAWLLRAMGRWLLRVLRPAVRAAGSGFTALSYWYVRILPMVLAHPGRTLGLALLAFAASAVLATRLGTELIPTMAQGRIQMELQLPPGTPIEVTDKTVAGLQSAVARLPEVAQVYAVSGNGNRLDANPTESGEHIARLLIDLKPSTPLSAEARVLAALRAIAAHYPRAKSTFSRPALFDFSTPLEIEVVGHDLQRLRALAQTVANGLRKSDRFADVKSSAEAGFPEVRIVFDAAHLARLGLEVRSVADEVVRQLRGTIATRYTLKDRKIDVRVRVAARQRARIADIRNLLINPRSAHPLRLADVAQVNIGEGPAEIRRANQQRVAVVSANLSYGDLGTAVTEVRQRLAKISIPPGFGVRVTGQSEDMAASFSSMKMALLLAVFLVYLVMASQFESVVYPFVILFTIPLAGIGAVLALAVTGTSVSVVVFIGVIMLAGIVVNNAIVLVDRINQLRSDGMELAAAVVEAGRNRLRPILITTLTTVLGLLPMALGLGEGAEVRAPMAITVIGGLSVSTLLTLLVIPSLYSLLARMRWPAAGHSDADLQRQRDAGESSTADTGAVDPQANHHAMPHPAVTVGETAP